MYTLLKVLEENPSPNRWNIWFLHYYLYNLHTFRLAPIDMRVRKKKKKIAFKRTSLFSTTAYFRIRVHTDDDNNNTYDVLSSTRVTHMTYANR